MWPGYMSWSTAQKDFFRGMIYAGVENTFEPSDLTVSLAADNTDQDAKFIPVPTYHSDPNVIARTTCDTGSAAIYGANHHRVCDKKFVTIFQTFWESGLSGNEMLYNVLAHEFGHAVGLRHSDSPCLDYATNAACTGVSETGNRQWNSFTPTPGTASLMFSIADAGASTSLSLYDYANINTHY